MRGRYGENTKSFNGRSGCVCVGGGGGNAVCCQGPMSCKREPEPPRKAYCAGSVGAPSWEERDPNSCGQYTITKCETLRVSMFCVSSLVFLFDRKASICKERDDVLEMS